MFLVHLYLHYILVLYILNYGIDKTGFIHKFSYVIYEGN